jgi:hypothetical protein
MVTNQTRNDATHLSPALSPLSGVVLPLFSSFLQKRWRLKMVTNQTRNDATHLFPALSPLSGVVLPLTRVLVFWSVSVVFE